MQKKKLPRDPNSLAARIVALSTGQNEPDIGSVQANLDIQKNPAAVALGRLGGLKGGKARAEKLSANRRAAIAKKAAKARWNKNQ